MSDRDFISTVTWEGGVLGALEYGLTADKLEDQNSDLANAWRKLERIYAAQFQPALSAAEDIIRQYE